MAQIHTNFGVSYNVSPHLKVENGLYLNKYDSENNNVTSLLDYLEISLLDLMIINDLLTYVDQKYRQSAAFIIGILFSNIQAGILYFNLDCFKPFSRVPKKLRYHAYNFLEIFINNLVTGCYDEIIDRNDGKEFKPLVLDSKMDSRLLYFQKFFLHQRIVNQHITFFSNKSSEIDRVIKHRVDSIIEEIYSQYLVLRDKKNQPIARDPYQIRAIQRALLFDLSVISGGPGTGKTSLVTNIIRGLIRLGVKISNIFLGAPTGRAANRMTESIHSSILTVEQPSPIDLEILKLNGYTIHKILNYKSHKNGFVYGKHYKLPASVLILDEVSMVDVILMSRVLEALDISKTKLILLGDKDQLPSVNAGSVLADIIVKNKKEHNFNANLTILKTTYRSSIKLVELAKKINLEEHINLDFMNFNDALSMSKGKWAFVPSYCNDSIESDVIMWVKYHYAADNKYNFLRLVLELKNLININNNINESTKIPEIFDSIFNLIKYATILTFVKKGNRGSYKVNNCIADYIRSLIGQNDSEDANIFDGAIIMITQNDYSKTLFNGDTGIIVSNQTSGEYYAYFKNTEEYSAFPVTSLVSWELAYAITIHKSQGLEFRDVMMLLPENNECKLLMKETVYTGISRASDRVIIYGDEQVLRFGISQSSPR